MDDLFIVQLGFLDLQRVLKNLNYSSSFSFPLGSILLVSCGSLSYSFTVNHNSDVSYFKGFSHSLTPNFNTNFRL